MIIETEYAGRTEVGTNKFTVGAGRVGCPTAHIVCVLGWQLTRYSGFPIQFFLSLG